MKNYSSFSSLNYDYQQHIADALSASNHPYIESYKQGKLFERKDSEIKQLTKHLMFSYGIFSDSTSIFVDYAQNTIVLDEAYTINVQKFLNEMFSRLKENDIEIKSTNKLLFDENFTNRFIHIRFQNGEIVLKEANESNELSNQDLSFLKEDIENWLNPEMNHQFDLLTSVLNSLHSYLSTSLYLLEELSQHDFIVFDENLNPVIPSTNEIIEIQ